MMESFTDVSVVIGATDETEALTETVDTISGVCRAEDVREIIIVYSPTATEGCLAAIKALEEKYPGTVRGMLQSRPYIGGAIRDGFDSAKASHLMLFPGDMALDVRTSAEMIELARRYPDRVIKTSRWIRKDSFHGYPGGRKALNAAAQVFLRALYGARVTDLTNPVQIMPRSLYDSVDWRELNFPFLIELVLCPLRLGVAFTEIPADCFGRREGVSKNSARQTALYLATALRIRFTRPSKIKKQ